jgi:N-acetylmuramoyl-L-alanine amidase
MLGIAATFGFTEWEPIWNLAQNKKLRELRPDPSVLAEGDVVFVPDLVPQVFVLETGKRHRIVIKRLKAAIRLQLLHLDATPIAGAKYAATPARKPLEGQTDGDGWFEQKVLADASELELAVTLADDPDGPRYIWRLAIGHLDPVDTASGLQQRLANLGYWPAGESEAATLPFGLRAFQEDHDIEVTGEADQATQDKLKEVHGGI